MSRDCVVILAGHEPDDIADLNRCLALLGHNVLASCRGGVDVLVFHEAAFERHKRDVVATFPIKYVPVEFRVPDYAPAVMAAIPEYFQHPTQAARGRPGFTMGYRHMCRFFGGAMYDHPALHGYRRYLRLDTDSAVLTPLGYDLFSWAEELDVGYSYLAPGVQQDCPLVSSGLWPAVGQWVRDGRVPVLRSPESIPDRTVYWTNFELGDIAWFRGREYQAYWRFVDSTGGIYLHRWGDHLIKYLGVNMLMAPARIKPVVGLTYQHGAVFRV